MSMHAGVQIISHLGRDREFGTAIKVNAVFTAVSARSCLVSPLLGIKIWDPKGE